MTTATREDYLKQILLEQQRARAGRAGAGSGVGSTSDTAGDGAVPMGKLADLLGVAGASVTGMVKALVDSDLVEYEPYKGVRLTAAGEQTAMGVIRRHRLLEQFLVETLGLDWTEVHEEAERLEHAISDRLLDRIDAYLGHPTVDPHGDPIPTSAGAVRQAPLIPLARAAVGRAVRIVRVTDQSTSFLQFVDRIGLRPGAAVTVTEVDAPAETLTLTNDHGDALTLALVAAGKLMVEAA